MDRAIPGHARSWPDAFPPPTSDARANEKNPRRVLERAEAWRPWRAYAVMHLWNSPKKD
jgi:AraC family transcriptional regulator of adaptative response / DNA-3-methyladenine glycosylase II